MCINLREITNKYNGHDIYVNCGHCLECDYDRSQKRREMLSRLDFSKYDVAFVTCTYRNECLPFISKSDLYLGETLSVFRFQSYRYVPRKKVGNSYATECVSQGYKHITSISSLDIPKCFELPNNDARVFRNGYYIYDEQYSEYIPVVCQKDVQDFIKRVSINLQRHKYNGILKYWYVTEYGETTLRPHFHVLFFTEKGSYNTIQKACRKAWPYGNNGRRFCEKAIKPQKYLSAYMFGTSELPRLFQDCKTIAPSCNHSQFFVFQDNNADYLRDILAMYRKVDFSYRQEYLRGETLASRHVHLPAYILNYYFPKFRGFSRFDAHEIFSIIADGCFPSDYMAYNPPLFRSTESGVDCIHTEFWEMETLSKKGQVITYFKRDLNIIMNSLFNAFERFKLHYLLLYPNTPFEQIGYIYADMYSNIWTKFSSSLLKFSYRQVIDQLTLREHFYDQDINKHFRGSFRHTFGLRPASYGVRASVLAERERKIKYIHDHSKLQKFKFDLEKRFERSSLFI